MEKSIWVRLRDALVSKFHDLFTKEEHDLIFWAHNFLEQISPVLRSIADIAVKAAEEIGADGATKFKTAYAQIADELGNRGLPIVENAIKGAIEISVANLKAVG